MTLVAVNKNIPYHVNGVKSRWSGKRYILLEEDVADKYEMLVDNYGLEFFAMEHVWVWYMIHQEPNLLSKSREEIDKYLLNALLSKFIVLNTQTGELGVCRTTWDIRRWAGLDA